MDLPDGDGGEGPDVPGGDGGGFVLNGEEVGSSPSVAGESESYVVVVRWGEADDDRGNRSSNRPRSSCS